MAFNRLPSADGRSPACFEEQARYVGIDNTFTRFNDTATYCIETDGGAGPTIEFSQTPEGGWTDQFVNQWVPNLTQAATDAGVKWILEAAFVSPSNPADISGGNSGLPGVLTPAIAQQFVDNAMSWRFLQITVCPGSPTPTRFFRKASDIYGDEERNLLITPTQLGPFREFRVCEECTKDGIETDWYVRNDVPEADPNRLEPFSWDKITDTGQIPKCAVPCGTIAVAPSPTSPTCQFELVPGCDNGNPIPNTNPQEFTRINGIYEYCDGALGPFFTQDVQQPDGTFVAEDYVLQGVFVDCDTGEPIIAPNPPCENSTFLGNLWRLKGNPTPSTLVEWWADPNGPVSGSGAPHGNVSDIFTNDGTTLTHVNGPADRSYVSPVFSVEGTNASDFISGMGLSGSADSTGTDQGKLSAYFVLPANARLRDGGTRTGERGGLYLNECCSGDLTLLEERTTDTTSAERGVFNGTIVPAGIHYAEAAISDLSAWWNLTLEASFDDGETYQPLIGYAGKPQYECIPIRRCDDTGVLVHGVTGALVVEDEFTTWCEPKGCPDCCSGGDSAEPTPLPQTLRVAIQ